MLAPVILCGGSGTRLWPRSRTAFPKQFLDLWDNGAMLIGTLRRLQGLDDLAQPLVLCGMEHRFLVAENLRTANISPGGILLEPVAKNTAPAVTLAALEALHGDPAASLLVLPADHAISDITQLHHAIRAGLELLSEHHLITFGVVPTKPETGYGYIKKGRLLGAGPASSIAAFMEKPNLASAESYLQSDAYLWNSGMFLFRAADWLAEMEKYAPDILSICRTTWQTASRGADFITLAADIFRDCRADSIDYAIMEKTTRGAVVPLEAGWSDVGSWESVWENSGKDSHSNHLAGDVLAVATSNSYLSATHRLLAVIGVTDLVVVETADAVLVTSRSGSQEVKQIVALLKESGRTEADQHRKVSRPWGFYDSLEMGENFQVKRIVLNPGGRLSLQKHHHRAEHWIVTRGIALVTCADETFALTENQACHIPKGAKHRLENQTGELVEIIEVQLGNYLGEDDIVRYEDIYGRQG